MRVTVLSPHRDDAAFSCSLVLRALLNSGATLSIVNVFTISSYAPYLFADDAGDSAHHGQADRVTAVRREEDNTFVSRLIGSLAESSAAHGVVIETIDLAWKDAPLRWRVEDELVLAPGSLPLEEVELLCHQFEALTSADLFLVPLSLGGHVDHRLVHQAALRALPTEKLLFYEDLPYACRLTRQEREQAAEKTKSIGPSRFLPAKAAPGWRLQFALCYPSQISREVAEEMETYALGLGARERFYGSPQALSLLESNLEETGAAPCR